MTSYCRATIDHSMPTLVNDLSSPQRTWLFETFGHYGDNDELQEVAQYQPRERRFSDPQRDPYQYQPPRDGNDSPGNSNSIFRRGGRPPTVPHEKHQTPMSWSPTARAEHHHFDSRGFNVRPPFQLSNSRAGPPEDLSLKRYSDAGGKASPIFPHQEEKLTWQQSYENLQVYMRTYGDCNVPQKYKLNVKLGGWVVSILMYAREQVETLFVLLTHTLSSHS